MTVSFPKGRYLARLACTDADLWACQALRNQCFFGRAGRDVDSFDATWAHMMVEDGVGGPLVCTFRFMQFAVGQAGQGYAAQYYDLSPLETSMPAIEIGRFCVAPSTPDPHILRVAWGALTQIVDQSCAQTLFGCASFEGVVPDVYAKVFARLAQRHIGPLEKRPGRKGVGAVDLIDFLGAECPVERPMPPLLRTYIAMGGWVSDHAVIDETMNTMHVLTVVEIAKIPPARAKALRALV